MLLENEKELVKSKTGCKYLFGWIISDIDSIYHYNSEGKIDVSSALGYALYEWLKSHPFANLRKNETDKHAMSDLVEKFLVPFNSLHPEEV